MAEERDSRTPAGGTSPADREVVDSVAPGSDIDTPGEPPSVDVGANPPASVRPGEDEDEGEPVGRGGGGQGDPAGPKGQL
jgi:hypothetical protein